MLNGIERSMAFFCLSIFLLLHSFPSFLSIHLPLLLLLPISRFRIRTPRLRPKFSKLILIRRTSISILQTFSILIHIHISNISFLPPYFFFSSSAVSAYEFASLCMPQKKEKTYKMTSKPQRKIRSVSKTAACAAVEGALDTILYGRKKKEMVNLWFCLAMRG